MIQIKWECLSLLWDVCHATWQANTGAELSNTNDPSLGSVYLLEKADKISHNLLWDLLLFWHLPPVSLARHLIVAVLASQHTYTLSQCLHYFWWCKFVFVPTIISEVQLYGGGNLHLFHCIMLAGTDWWPTLSWTWSTRHDIHVREPEFIGSPKSIISVPFYPQLSFCFTFHSSFVACVLLIVYLMSLYIVFVTFLI